MQVRTPLFARLIDDDPLKQTEDHVNNTMSIKELRESIRGEISMLLNTRQSRIPFSFNDDKEYKLKLSNAYGLPDFSHFGDDKDGSILRLASTMAHVIGKYEPRLKEVKVQALEYDDNQQSLHLEITGRIIVDKHVEQYTFPISIEDVGK